MINLTIYKYKIIGKWPCMYKAFNLNLKENINLKSILYNDGFFDFNIRNKGHLVYYHQIVAFYLCGGIHALKRGFICDSNIYEVHHINGNTLDNSKENLIYLPVILHREITTVQRNFCKYIRDFRQSNGADLSSKLRRIPIWNKKGRLVKGIFDFVFLILKKTIYHSSFTFKRTINYKELNLWIKKTVKNLKGFLPIYHVPITFLC